MESLPVVKREPAAQPLPKIGTIVKRPEVDTVILQRPPSSFDEDVVLGTTSVVHTDGNAQVRLSERGCGYLSFGPIGNYFKSLKLGIVIIPSKIDRFLSPD